MAGEEEKFDTCEECGASIYPEHIAKGIAEQFEGRLLCVHCLRTRRAEAEKRDAGPTAPGAVPIAVVESEDSEFDRGDLPYDTKPTAIRSFGGGPGGMTEGLAISEDKLRRSLTPESPNATRCRIFHCKLSDASFAYMCDQINEWADSRDDINIKFVTSCIGVVEGKHADAHLIVTVFY